MYAGPAVVTDFGGTSWKRRSKDQEKMLNKTGEDQIRVYSIKLSRKSIRTPFRDDIRSNKNDCDW